MSSTTYEGQQSDHGTRSSEVRSSIDPLIKNEVERNVVEVKAEAFVRAFLYPSAALGDQDPVLKRDRLLAMACHDLLKKRVTKNEVLMQILADENCPKYSKNAFTLLDPDVDMEKDLYTPFRMLFTFIKAFYQVFLPDQSVSLDIDAAWPAAVDPNPHTPEDPTSFKGPLRRDFFDTHRVKLKFSPRFVGETADLEPDLVLMLHRNKDPNKKQSSVYWKDVMVPLEVKKDFHSEGEIIPQVARYARAILMEQFDRKFAITVALSATQCRLFHWDSVGCHATQIIDIHKDPILFIRCIARLAMMTPAELGYDEHFSNAGRVLSDQELTTTLTVHESPIQRYLDTEAGSAEMQPNTANSKLLELDTKKFLFESRGILFHRHTRVWRGKEILDKGTWRTGPTRVVKQNWAEDTRPCEGYFYKLTEQILTVSSLLLMEECDHTWAYHNRVTEQDVIGYLKATETKPDRQPRGKAVPRIGGDRSTFGPDPKHDLNTLEQRSCTPLNENPKPVGTLERVLLRFVFEEEHRPLSQARDSKEVMDATVQWIEGLIALDRLGIVHRDISYSNLMLPAISQDSDTPQTAKIIDLGLAHLKEVQRADEPPSSLLCPPSIPETSTDRQEPSLEGGVGLGQGDSPSPNARTPRAHHHITGTLPFIAIELIRQLSRPSNTTPIEHTLQHDIESVFWVLFYLCHVTADLKPTDPMTTRLRGLTSPDIGFVASMKSDILGMDRDAITDIAGPFYMLRDFLKAFADHWFACYFDKKTIDASKVLELAIEHRDKLGESGEGAASVTVQQPAPVTPPRLTATFDSSKRKSSTFEDSSVIGEPSGQEFEDEVGAPRKKTKLP